MSGGRSPAEANLQTSQNSVSCNTINNSANNLSVCSDEITVDPEFDVSAIGFCIIHICSHGLPSFTIRLSLQANDFHPKTLLALCRPRRCAAASKSEPRQFMVNAAPGVLAASPVGFPAQHGDIRYVERRTGSCIYESHKTIKRIQFQMRDSTSIVGGNGWSNRNPAYSNN